MKKSIYHKTNERGATMTEILGVICLAGILSIAIFWGWNYANKRNKVSLIGELISKSIAGAVTGHIAENQHQYWQALTDEERKKEPEFRTLELSDYISDVAPATVDGVNNIFQSSAGGAIISVSVVRNGEGFIANLNQLQTEICEDVLLSNIEYDYVVQLEGKDRLPATESPVLFDEAQVRENAGARKMICENLTEGLTAGKTLNVGLVFTEELGFETTPIKTSSCHWDGTNYTTEQVFGVWYFLNASPSCPNNNYLASAGDGRDCCICRDSMRMNGSDCSCKTNYVDTGIACECINGFTETAPGKCECIGENMLIDPADGHCKTCADIDPAMPVLVNGKCQECQTNEDCINNQQNHPDEPICIDNQCKGCKVQADCLDNETCDTKAHVCEACPGNQIATSANTCGCPTGLYLPKGSETCICGNEGATCSQTTPCCGEYTCLLDGNHCCPDKSMVWSDGKCTCPPHTKWDDKSNRCIANECDETKKCTDQTKYCDLTVHKCKKCSETCGGKVSEDGTSCVYDLVCPPGEYCLTTDVKNCSEEGTKYICSGQVLKMLSNDEIQELPLCSDKRAQGNLCRVIGKNNGQTFVISDVTMIQEDAVRYCENLGMHLATWTEACEYDPQKVVGYFCKNLVGLFPYKAATSSAGEHLWALTAYDSKGTCSTVSITNQCGDNHLTNKTARLFALCAPGEFASVENKYSK